MFLISIKMLIVFENVNLQKIILDCLLDHRTLFDNQSQLLLVTIPGAVTSEDGRAAKKKEEESGSGKGEH